jgi:hypothetical protein
MRLERQRAQPRDGMGDAEDPRQPGGLLGADAAAFEHHDARPAARQLVGRGQPADAGADNDDVVL